MLSPSSGSPTIPNTPRIMDQQTLRRARRYARQHFNENYTHGHASHAVAKALEAAARKFNLPYEVCGWADGIHEGIQYLNTGDSYGQTLVAKTDYASVRFTIGCWADQL